MGLFSSFFGGGSPSGKPSGRKTIATGAAAFTTGSEEIVMPLPRIAFTPPAGFSPYAAGSKEQKPTDVRIVHPSLMGNGGIIMGVLYPSDGKTIEERVDQFVSGSKDRVVQRTKRRSPSGIEITFLHTAGPLPGKDRDVHLVLCYFVNAAGETAHLQCVGSTEANALASGEAIVRTLRFTQPGE